MLLYLKTYVVCMASGDVLNIGICGWGIEVEDV